MVYTNTWNSTYETVPQDADDVGDGAGEIRDFKLSIRERFAHDHYMDIAGTDADHGEHTVVTLRTQSSDPSNVASKGMLFSKTPNSITELFYLSDTNSLIQLTQNGNVGADTTNMTCNVLVVAATIDAGSGTTKRLGPKGTFVSNANGNPNIDDANVYVTSVAEGQWGSVGPTGSGADLVWPALDNVPDDANFIEVKFYGTGQDCNAGSSDVYGVVRCRENGSSETAGVENMVFYIAARSESTLEGSSYPASGANITIHKIPISSSMFDVNWGSNFTSFYVQMILVGWGFNP